MKQSVIEGANAVSGCISLITLFLVILAVMYFAVRFVGPF